MIKSAEHLRNDRQPHHCSPRRQSMSRVGCRLKDSLRRRECASDIKKHDRLRLRKDTISIDKVVLTMGTL